MKPSFVPSVSAFLVTSAAILVSTTSAGDVPPAAKIAPRPGPGTATLLKAPKILYPASGVAYEQTIDPTVSVYAAWDFLPAEDTIAKFDICWFPDGESCGPPGTYHRSVSNKVRGFRFEIPAATSTPKWRFKVGACKSEDCTWSEERVLTVYRKWGQVELIAPEQGTTVNLPSSMTFTWKDVPGAEYYLHCNQDRTYPAQWSWQCPDAPNAEGTRTIVTRIEKDKPAFSKEFITPSEQYTLLAGAAERRRGWGVAACRVIQKQLTDTAPVTETSCKHSDLRPFTAKKS